MRLLPNMCSKMNPDFFVSVSDSMITSPPLSSQDSFRRARSRSRKTRNLKNSSLEGYVLPSPQRLITLLTNIIYGQALPFRIVESNEVKAFFAEVFPCVRLPSRRVVARSLLERFAAEQLRLKVHLGAISHVSLTADVWQSPNKRQDCTQGFL